MIEEQNYVYVDDNYKAEEALEFLSVFPRLGYDVETTGLKVVDGQDKLLLMQLGTEEVAYLFDPRKMDGNLLRPILENPNILKIGHNLKFDYQATRRELGIQLDGMFDTQLAYRLLTSGLIDNNKGGFIPMGEKHKKQFPYKSLAFLAKKFLGINMDKSVRTSFINHQYHKEFTPKQLQYAADDVLFLHPLVDILSSMLQDEGLIDAALLEFEFLRPCSEMEINGVTIDQDHWRRIIQEAKSQSEVIREEITVILEPFQDQNTLFGASTVNISSKDQILDAFEKLGFPLDNTEENTLKSVDHPLASHLLQWRGYDKLVSTYGEPVLQKISRQDHRLHATFHQLGTTTGRLSSDKPNLQNMPQDREDEFVKISFRECFQALPGNKMLTADYSQCIAEDEPVSSQWGLVCIKDFESPAVEIIDVKTGELKEDLSAHRVPSYNSEGLVSTNFKANKGVKETVVVHTEDGFEVRCTPDHLVKVMDDSGAESWKQASDLSTSDNLVLSRNWVGEDCHPSVGISPEEALFFGYFIGDGSFSSGGIQIAKGEPKYGDVYAQLNNICERFFGKELKNYPNTTSWDLIGRNYHRLWKHVGILREWNSHTKEVPSVILKGGRCLIGSFLRGLFDADGWVVNKNSNHLVAFSTRSEKLSRQVQLLLLSLGIFSKRASYNETTLVGGREYSGVQHRVSICDTFNLRRFYEQVGFLSAEKSKILQSLVTSTHAAYSDYVVLSIDEKENLKEVARMRKDWPDIRKDLFANYFNSNKEFIRHYSRTKLEEVCRELGTPLLKTHLAFSKVREVAQSKPVPVYDISVPSQNMFVAGGVFVHNCELRILAEVSQDRRFIEIFEGGGDLHMITAQQVFGFSDSELAIYNEVKKKDHPSVNLLDLYSESDVSMYHKVYDFRSKTKVINFGIAYGLSAWSLAERFKIPQGEAEGILDDYFNTYSGIKRWLDRNGHESIALRHSKTIIGRKRYYTLADPEDDQMFRRSKNATRRAGNNAVIQGTNADITKEALNRLQRVYDDIEGAKLLFTVHDEIVSEVPEEKAEEIAEIKAEIMKEAFHRFVQTVPVGTDDKVEVTIADHWNK